MPIIVVAIEPVSNSQKRFFGPVLRTNRGVCNGFDQPCRLFRRREHSQHRRVQNGLRREMELRLFFPPAVIMGGDARVADQHCVT
jgi:hypothetical protein